MLIFTYEGVYDKPQLRKAVFFPSPEMDLCWFAHFHPTLFFQILLPVVILVIACDHESECESLSLEADLEEKCSK